MKGEKKPEKDIKILLKKKKKKSVNIIVNVIKISLNTKKKNQSSIEEIMIYHVTHKK